MNTPNAANASRTNFLICFPFYRNKGGLGREYRGLGTGDWVLASLAGARMGMARIFPLDILQERVNIPLSDV